MDTLACSHCGAEKPDDEFYRGQARCTGRRGRTSWCKDCINAKPQRPRPEQRRKWHLKKAYGVTPEQVDALLAQQGGCCAICGTEEPGVQGWSWCVDHDHVSGRVRGILCNNCNTGLGRFDDSAELLKSAIRYLTQSS